MSGSLRLKSLSDPVSPEDGTRILVTRWRARGEGRIWTEWHQTVAPSARLLREAKQMQTGSYGAAAAAWAFYLPRYLREMACPAPRAAIELLRARLAAGETITLLCYCRDERYCHRSLLRDLILEVV